MPRLRTLVCLLLLLALPLKGWAAAAMDFCPAQTFETVAAVASEEAAAHHHQDAPAAHHQQADTPSVDSTASSTDMGHACGVCAMLCHSMGLTASPAPLPLGASPHTLPLEPWHAFYGAAEALPYKPPRA